MDTATRLLAKAEATKDPTIIADTAECVNKLSECFLNLRCFDASTNIPKAELIKELRYVAQVLELQLLLAAIREDSESFERTYQELEGVYFHPYLIETMETTDRQVLIIALALMWHLSHDNLEDFHILLRKIAGAISTKEETFCGKPLSKMTQSDRALLDFPIKLERDIMDGNIARVLNILSENMPHAAFEWCMRPLVGTLRHRVAACLESAYERVSVQHAMKLLAFRNPKELLAFVEREQARKAAAEPSGGADDDWLQCAPSVESIPERPSTPSTAGRDKAASSIHHNSLSRSSSTGLQFGLARRGTIEREFAAIHPESEQKSRGLDGDLLRTEIARSSKIRWHIGSQEIQFTEVSRPKALIPAYDLMSQWLSFAVDLEAVV